MLTFVPRAWLVALMLAGVLLGSAMPQEPAGSFSEINHNPPAPGRTYALAGLAVIAAAVLVLVLLGFKKAIKRWRLDRLAHHVADLLEASEIQEALETIQQARKGISDKKLDARWAKLEMRAIEQRRDVADLCRLFYEIPVIFAERESAALMVARAQIEEDRVTDFAVLRNAWRKHEAEPEAWHALEVDALLKQGQEENALELLTSRNFEGSKDADRCARLAFVKLRDDPEESASLLARALNLNPKNPDVHIYRGIIMEAQGRWADALAAYRTAADCAPKNLFLCNRLADAHRRKGDFAQAMAIWSEGLEPPSIGLIWLKAIFWSRVALPCDIKWVELKPPPGRLRLLVEFLLNLEPSRFWDAKAFAPIAEHQPEFLARQEVYWLRLFEALRTGAEGEALTLLNLQGYGVRSWNPALATALLRIVLCRRSGFVGTLTEAAHEAARMATLRHPFFMELDSWTQVKGLALPEDASRLLKSDFAFPAAMLAAGWPEAGLRLLKSTDVPPDFPEWLKCDVEEALKRRQV